MLCTCMRFEKHVYACVRRRERTKERLILLHSSAPLCINDAPLSHDSHELSAAAAAAAAAAEAVSFSPAARDQTHALLSLSEL